MTGQFADRLFRLTFALAGAYNIAFGLWAVIWPQAFFSWFVLDPPRYPAIWACLGMVVGVYGLLYLHAARHLETARPIIAVGLLGKVLGPIGMVLTFGWTFALLQVQTLPFAVGANYAYAVLPLFVLMGSLAGVSGITTDLYRSAHRWFSGVRGGLYLATIAGSAGFAAASGSTVVNAVVFTRLALPEMMRFGYSRSLSVGCIAASGTFAAMIPPSITMVLYAIITEQSVGALLVAGLCLGFGGCGVRGSLDPRVLLLTAAVTLWVAGFDILYACQDVDFDRKAQLASIPAQLGIPLSLRLAFFCHAVMLVMLLLLYWIAAPTLGWVYLAGVVGVAALILYEHWLVRPDDPIFLHDHDTYIEVTESVPITHFELCLSVIREVRARGGVHLVVDDLGAGYSNLKRIIDLEPRVVKPPIRSGIVRPIASACGPNGWPAIPPMDRPRC